MVRIRNIDLFMIKSYFEKSYVVMPSTSTYQQQPQPSIFTAANNDTNFDSSNNIRLNYINPIPYTRQVGESSLDLRSDEYIKNAQKLLNQKPQITNYDGEE